MVRFIVLSLWLVGCYPVSKDVPKIGKEVEAPYGWTDTYCPSHKNEIGKKTIDGGAQSL
mgnify:CR=1 FL=1